MCFKLIQMKILIDILDNKANSLMELLNSMSHIKVQPLTESKAILMKEIRDAVEEMKEIKLGKKKVRNAEDFLNEL